MTPAPIVTHHEGGGAEDRYTYTWSNGDTGPTTTAGFGLPPIPDGIPRDLIVSVTDRETGVSQTSDPVRVTISVEP